MQVKTESNAKCYSAVENCTLLALSQQFLLHLFVLDAKYIWFSMESQSHTEWERAKYESMFRFLFSFQFELVCTCGLVTRWMKKRRKKWATKTRVAGAFSFKESWLLAAIVDHVMITAGEIGMVSISYASISHIHSKVSTVNALGFGFSLRKQQ